MSRIVLASDGTEIHYETVGDPKRPALFMGPHFYLTREAHDPFFTDLWVKALKSDFYLIVADYPRGIGLTRHPQGAAFSADIAAEEYVTIARAAGVERFAWLGYSFGGAMGLQLACRTGLLTALAIGGFPPLNAPFGLLREISARAVGRPHASAQVTDAGVLESAVAFYGSLLEWPERTQVARLHLPRLVFMGDEDEAQGATEPIPLADLLRSAEAQLRSLGWELTWLKGSDHVSAIRPDVALEGVREFLCRSLLDR